MRLLRPVTLAAAAALALAGCGGGSSDQPTTSPTSTATTSPGEPMPAYAVPSVDAGAAKTFKDRCGVDVPGELMSFTAPQGSRLEGAVLGAGGTVAVFLHQTDETAMCGWAQYAGWATTKGVRAVLVNFCNWGVSDCKGDLAGEQVAQVKAVVTWARAHGATRVTLVGASMGGSVALAAAQQVGADAVMDLSGPSQRPPLPDAQEAAAATKIPLLLGVSPGDLDVSPAKLEAAVKASPADPKAFVASDGGHGWELVENRVGDTSYVSGLGQQVLAWVEGDYRT